MTVRVPLGRRLISLLWPLAGVAALMIALLPSGTRDLVSEALAQVRPMAVVVALPGQALASLLCGAALFALRPGVTLGASVASRLLRDAGANLLLFMPGIGEVIGGRALILAGGRARLAVTAIALDNVAETLAQVPFAALVLVVLNRGIRLPEHVPAIAADWFFWVAVALPSMLIPFVLACRYSPRGRDARHRLATRLRTELALLQDEMRHQRRGFPMAVGLHLCAWATGGIQLWLVSTTLSVQLGLFPAIVIESVAYAGRAIMFFVPAGLAVQEAALVFAGLSYGLSPSQSLAIALVLRLRDLVFGLPLLFWPLLEFRGRVLPEEDAGLPPSSVQ